jgi:hypothetical protein
MPIMLSSLLPLLWKGCVRLPGEYLLPDNTQNLILTQKS